MNHIVEEEKKDELTTYIEDGYKVIYPNNNLSIKLIRKYRDDSWDSVRTASHIKSSFNCWGISLYDRLVKNKNSLFLSPGDFNSGALKLVIKRARAEATIDLRAVRIYIEEETVVIMIDDNFCSKHEKKQTAKMKAKEEFTSNIKDLLN